MKRIISLVLLLAITCVCFAGCGSKEDTGSAHLVWAMAWHDQSDRKLVQDEINKKLAEKLPDTEIEFMYDPSLSSKWSLLMAGNTQIDITNTGTSLVSEVPKKSFYALDDLIDKYAPTVKKERDELYVNEYKTGMMNGELYAIPNVQQHINDTAVLQIPCRTEKYFNAEAFKAEIANSATSTDKLYQILDDYLQAAKAGLTAEDKEYVSQYISIGTVYALLARRGYDFIGAGFSASAPSNIGYKVSDDKAKLVDFYTTDEFKTYIKWADKWFNEGFISKDILSGDTGIGSKYALLYCFTSDMYYAEDGYRIYQNTNIPSKGRVSYCMQPNEQKFLSHFSLGSLETYSAIPTTSRHPERAMKFIELLRTEEGAEILNLLCYGIEGKHYEKLSDTEIRAFEYQGQGNSSISYGVPGWMVSTHLSGMYVCEPYNEGLRSNARKYYKEVKPNFHKTPIYGMSFDLASGDLGNDVAQWEAVLQEYHLQVITGASPNEDTVMASAQKKLKEVGIKELIKTLQKQMDEYAKNNK